ncbi:Phage-related holin (Lysis protein) [uncultured Clostridium sp.]|nr:Phage-related holin (Lysis protein) [uncultured Clostridium sp.]
MNLYDERFNLLIATAGTFLTWLFGAWDIALMVLVCFMVLDYLTGLIKAYLTKKLSSNVGLHGIARKSVILIVLIMSVMLDRILNSGTWVFRTLVCYFYIANEGLSILENCSVIGLPIPNKIQEALEQLKNKESEVE